MPFTLILAIMMLITAVTLTVVRIKHRRNLAAFEAVEDERRKNNEGRSSSYGSLYKKSTFGDRPFVMPLYAPAAAYSITALLLVMASIVMVGTKQVGVVTSFNRPIDTMSNGIHLKAPWQQVTEMDGTIQTDSYVGNDEGSQCIDIRIGNGSVACIDTTIRWRIVGEQADVLFQDYRNQSDDVNDAIQNSLVKRELTGALNEVYGSYDPLAAVKGGKNIEVDALSAKVQTAMFERIETLGEGTPQVEVLSVTTPLIRLDTTTQGKIDAYQQEVANTRIAEQKQATAKAEAIANEEISDSIAKDPNVLAYKCLNIMEQLAKTDKGIPVGMYCFPGGNSPVIVPGTNS